MEKWVWDIGQKYESPAGENLDKEKGCESQEEELHLSPTQQIMSDKVFRRSENGIHHPRMQNRQEHTYGPVETEAPGPP